MKTKIILDTPICKIFQTHGYQVYIRAKDGLWVEMAIFPDDLTGLVNALDLSVNACSGKFFPAKGTARLDQEQIESQQKKITQK